jgi:hypothetical protein
MDLAVGCLILCLDSLDFLTGNTKLALRPP